MNISIEGIKKAITPKQSNCTSTFVWSCRHMEAIMAIAKEYNLYVIEDNAQYWCQL
jgi:dTDP-4-amino-4,6-dideoxygalactose transaminase